MTAEKLGRLLPKTFKLGGWIFKIKLTNDWIMHEGKKHWGMFNPRTQVLEVGNLKEMGTSSMLVSTFWHEMFHGLWYVAALPGKAKEEDAVSVLEQVYLGLIVDNPWLLPWTIKGLKNG